METVIVGNKYLTSCFRLAGVDTIEAADEEEAARKTEDLILQGTYNMIFITEKVALRLKDLREDLLKTRRFYPIFVIIPDLEGPVNERIRELHQLVNQAIGVKLELGG